MHKISISTRATAKNRHFVPFNAEKKKIFLGNKRAVFC